MKRRVLRTLFWAQNKDSLRLNRILGGKKFRLFARITAAISQFIPPISSARTDTEKDPTPQGYQHQGSQQEAAPDNVVPIRAATESAADAANKELRIAAQPGIQASLTATLMQAFTLFRENRADFLRWLGIKSYQKAANRQGTHRLRKGAIFDTKAG